MEKNVKIVTSLTTVLLTMTLCLCIYFLLTKENIENYFTPVQL